MSAGMMLLPIGKQLKAMRELRGLSQAELAGALGCSQPTVHRNESDMARIRFDTMTWVADALGCEVVVQLVPRELLALGWAPPAPGLPPIATRVLLDLRDEGSEEL